MAAPLARGKVFQMCRVSYCKLSSYYIEWNRTFTGRHPKKSVPSFVDFLQLKVSGGGGGQGFPKYGGFGGDGGKVIVTAHKKVKTLRQVLQKYPSQICKAGTGENSSKFHLLGDKGKDLEIHVPKGVIVHKADGQKGEDPVGQNLHPKKVK